MSKSKGNFYTVRQVLDGVLTPNPVDPAVLRYEMIKASYRGQMNFSARGLEDSAANVRRLRDFYGKQAGEASPVDLDHPVLKEFAEALADDLNVAGALAVVFAYVNAGGSDTPAETRGVMEQFDRVLGVLEPAAAGGSGGQDDGWAMERCAALDAARGAKDWATSDAVRDELQDAGYEVKNTPEGTVATKRLA